MSADITLPEIQEFIAGFWYHYDQGHVSGKVNVHEEGNFPLRERSLWREEAAIQRLSAAAGHGLQKPIAVAGSESPDSDLPPVPQRLDGFILCYFHAVSPFCVVIIATRCALRVRTLARAFIYAINLYGPACDQTFQTSPSTIGIYPDCVLTTSRLIADTVQKLLAAHGE